MKTHQHQMAALSLPSVILGLMRIADMPDAEIRALYDAAMDCGMTMFDQADIYGGTLHRCETRFGAALNLSSTDREGIMLQSKVGIRKEFF